MEASIVDLRYKTKEILQALDRNEEVRVLYRGRARGRIVPEGSAKVTCKVSEHAFFNSAPADEEEVDKVMERLRRPRI